MLEPLPGATDAERVLVFILSRGEGYGREIARFFAADADSIHKQLARLESGGVRSSTSAGRTRLYRFTPRYPFLPELETLLEKGLVFYPKEERELLLENRRRPRRHDKPL